LKKVSFAAILVSMIIFSCNGDPNEHNNYHFQQVQKTNHLEYKAGEIEGAVFHDRLENDDRDIKQDVIHFNDSNWDVLEKYLNRLDKIINAWFSEDSTNPFLAGFFSNKNIEFQRREYIDRKGEKNINKYKRLYSFEIDKNETGKVVCEVFFAGDNPNWANHFPAYSFGIREVAVSFHFIFNIASGKITVYAIVPI
jgi:hypothetical protein